ncbi:ABC transporter ATP-binding protein [Bosea sp. (in: a-proteobacteria)]|uniref:ABC transporter ATP-binding protein n=1 Tax=Bosea sp. (in: a-proteobacteria) TaxID=1871050 RepID=UPI002635228A|nr:ABC transporter ATP-binding protein [Bosea sp. (in: a-proteobacteria)]MCO5091326.1 ABC transporter ATP-binding protein [Bosea sp. (in: a-proteobacteria)]
MTLLTAAGLVAGYGAQDVILKSISVSVAAGEVVAILGPNGAGKSTFLKALAGVVPLRKGSILLAGHEISNLPPRELAKRGVAFVPQEHNVFPSLTIVENLEIGGNLHPSSNRERTEKVFERIPALAEKRRARAGALSGGQRQLLAMGMALMVDPRLVLLDEPTAGLSPAAAGDLFQLIRTFADSGIAVLLVEQNAVRALEFAERAYILVDGCNSREGPAAKLLADPEIRFVFLGEHAAETLKST